MRLSPASNLYEVKQAIGIGPDVNLNSAKQLQEFSRKGTSILWVVEFPASCTRDRHLAYKPTACALCGCTGGVVEQVCYGVTVRLSL